MPHTPLISTIVIGLVLAFVLGALANRLRVSPLVGYLLAGVAVGPFTPGFVADQAIARDLAEIGVILLMFGVGLQFSPKELLSVKAIAIPGALLQIVMATAFGAGLAWTMGWSAATGLVFGLALSVASTVVVIRVLDERRLIDSEAGRISVGWLIVEDLVMVLVIVLLPTLAGVLGGDGGSTAAPAELSVPVILTAIGITLGKAAAFVAVMLVVGQQVIPWAAKLERDSLAARRRGITKLQWQTFLEAVRRTESQREEQGWCWPGVSAALAPLLTYTVSDTPGLPMQFAK